MKTLLASALLIIGLAIPVKAQTSTNTPPIQLPGISWDFLTNLPPAPSFTAAKVGIDAGSLLRAGVLEAALKVSYYYNTNWAFSAQIQNGPGGDVIDAFDLRAGYRLAWNSADVSAQIGGRRTWNNGDNLRPSWQGGLFLSANWLPTTSGRWVLGTDVNILTSPTGSAFNMRPGLQFMPHIGYRF